MWEVGLSPSSVQFSSHHHFHKLSCSWLLGGADAPASRHVCLQLTWEVGLPFSPVEFSSLHHSRQLSCSWLLGASPRSCQRLSGSPGLFIYSPGKDSLPQSSAISAPHPLSCVSYLFLLLISQFLFFLGWRSVCPGGYAALAQACLWEYCGTVKFTWSASSQAIWVPVTGGPGAFLVSPFNVKWRFSVPAGGVEGSKLWLFSVIMPAKCVSGVSPRFHYRRLTFCFLPLADILESLANILLNKFFSIFLGPMSYNSQLKYDFWNWSSVSIH
jgi:hypothetical protein